MELHKALRAPAVQAASALGSASLTSFMQQTRGSTSLACELAFAGWTAVALRAAASQAGGSKHCRASVVAAGCSVEVGGWGPPIAIAPLGWLAIGIASLWAITCAQARRNW